VPVTTTLAHAAGKSTPAVVPLPHGSTHAPVLPTLQAAVDAVAALALAINVCVVFTSVVFRYFLHDPLEWSEEVARALMVTLVFTGAAAALGRGRHVGMDVARGLLPATWRPAVITACDWVVAFVALGLSWTSLLLLRESTAQTTSTGLPQLILVAPVVAGSVLLFVFAMAHAVNGTRRDTVVGDSLFRCGSLHSWRQCRAPGSPLRRPSIWRDACDQGSPRATSRSM